MLQPQQDQNKQHTQITTIIWKLKRAELRNTGSATQHSEPTGQGHTAKTGDPPITNKAR